MTDKFEYLINHQEAVLWAKQQGLESLIMEEAALRLSQQQPAPQPQQQPAPAEPPASPSQRIAALKQKRASST